MPRPRARGELEVRPADLMVRPGDPMRVLGLKFRVDDLAAEGKPLEGNLPEALLADSLVGLVGDLGFRPEGDASVSGTVYLSSGGEVIVHGQLKATVGFDCARCLASRSATLELDESHVLIKASPQGDGDREMVISSEDDDDGHDHTFSGDEVDLTELFRQNLLLALPMNPSCEFVGASGCQLDEGATGGEATIDPRWAPLLELKKKLN